MGPFSWIVYAQLGVGYGLGLLFAKLIALWLQFAICNRMVIWGAGFYSSIVEQQRNYMKMLHTK